MTTTGRDDGRTPPGGAQGAAWGRPLAAMDRGWTAVERWLCIVVLVLEIVALTVWIALKGLADRPDNESVSGIVLRGLVGAIVLSALVYVSVRKRRPLVQRVATVSALIVGAAAAKLWEGAGVDYASNLLNWLNQASSLTLFGGLRGVATRLTILLALLGGSLATASGKHITIDLVTRAVKGRLRTLVTLIGWAGTAVICFVASWGFFDHVAIILAPAEANLVAATPTAKVEAVLHELGEDGFLLRKQLLLDLKAAPHVLSGEPYADWLGGAEWNQWIKDEGFIARYGLDAGGVPFATALEVPPDAHRAPLVGAPGAPPPQGILAEAGNLMFPIGLFIIACRFVLLCLLTLAGHRDLDGGGDADGDPLAERPGGAAADAPATSANEGLSAQLARTTPPGAERRGQAAPLGGPPDLGDGLLAADGNLEAAGGVA